MYFSINPTPFTNFLSSASGSKASLSALVSSSCIFFIESSSESPGALSGAPAPTGPPVSSVPFPSPPTGPDAPEPPVPGSSGAFPTPAPS